MLSLTTVMINSEDPSALSAFYTKVLGKPGWDDGGYVGWQLRHAYGANSDLKVHKSRIPNFRKTRNRSGLTSLLLVVAVLFLLRLLMK